MLSLKKQLLELCHQAVDAKITACISAIALARESSREETKSSAGDKYETARAMIQQEIDKYSLQLRDAEKQKSLLTGIPETTDVIIRNGSLVNTNNGIFFISISIGPLVIEKETYLAISPVSPIGALLLGKRKGDTFQFRGNEYRVEEVE